MGVWGTKEWGVLNLMLVRERKQSRAVIHNRETQIQHPILRLWRPLLKKPPQRATTVQVVVDRESCEGRLTGAVKAISEMPEPLDAYSSLLFTLLMEGGTPEQVLLTIPAGTPPERRRAGIEAHDWFTKNALCQMA